MTADLTSKLEKLPAHLSVSQYTTYLSCPKQYQLERVYKVPQAPAYYFSGGSAFHEATEVYDRQAWEGTPPTVEATVDLALLILEDLYQKGLAQEPDESKWRRGGRVSKEWPEKETIAFYRAKMPQWIADYVAWRTRPGAETWLTLPGGEPAIESSFNVTLGKVPLKGAPDRVCVSAEGLVGVLDLKTGGSKPDSDFQLGVYAVVMEILFDVRPTWGAFYQARDGQTTVPVSLERYDREWLASAFGDVKDATEAGFFPPKLSSRCKTCSVNRYCRAFGGDLAGTVE